MRTAELDPTPRSANPTARSVSPMPAPLVQYGGDLLLAERRDQETHRCRGQVVFVRGVDQVVDGCLVATQAPLRRPLRRPPPRSRSHAYLTRRLPEGKTDRVIRRILKRYIARELYRRLTNIEASPRHVTRSPPIPLDARKRGASEIGNGRITGGYQHRHRLLLIVDGRKRSSHVGWAYAVRCH